MKPKRIVLAEDEAIIRLDINQTLTAEGYEIVGEAGDGIQAVALVREHKPDVAVLDIQMPVMDGLEAAREIMEDRLCAIVILTAHSQREYIDEATEVGAMAYVTKPFKPADLVPAIELASGRFRDMQALSKSREQLEAQLETRKIVDRAKGILMDELGMTENDSFRFVQKTAMSKRSTMRDVASAILDGSLRPDPE